MNVQRPPGVLPEEEAKIVAICNPHAYHVRVLREARPTPSDKPCLIAAVNTLPLVHDLCKLLLEFLATASLLYFAASNSSSNSSSSSSSSTKRPKERRRGLNVTPAANWTFEILLRLMCDGVLPSLPSRAMMDSCALPPHVVLVWNLVDKLCACIEACNDSWVPATDSETASVALAARVPEYDRDRERGSPDVDFLCDLFGVWCDVARMFRKVSRSHATQSANVAPSWMVRLFFDCAELQNMVSCRTENADPEMAECVAAMLPVVQHLAAHCCREDVPPPPLPEPTTDEQDDAEMEEEEDEEGEQDDNESGAGGAITTSDDVNETPEERAVREQREEDTFERMLGFAIPEEPADEEDEEEPSIEELAVICRRRAVRDMTRVGALHAYRSLRKRTDPRMAVVRIHRYLSRQLSCYAEQQRRQQQHLMHQRQQELLHAVEVAATAATDTKPPATYVVKKGKVTYPKDVTDLLFKWFAEHADRPYPNNLEKQQLATQTGLSMKQVSVWFSNVRNSKNGARRHPSPSPTSSEGSRDFYERT